MNGRKSEMPDAAAPKPVFPRCGHGNDTVIIAAGESVVDTVRQSSLPEFFLSRESRIFNPSTCHVPMQTILVAL